MKRNEFKAILARENKTQGDVAKHLGISENTMSQKLKKGVFGSDEIQKMVDYLNIQDPVFIFFS